MKGFLKTREPVFVNCDRNSSSDEASKDEDELSESEEDSPVVKSFEVNGLHLKYNDKSIDYFLERADVCNRLEFTFEPTDATLDYLKEEIKPEEPLAYEEDDYDHDHNNDFSLETRIISTEFASDQKCKIINKNESGAVVGNGHINYDGLTQKKKPNVNDASKKKKRKRKVAVSDETFECKKCLKILSTKSCLRRHDLGVHQGVALKKKKIKVDNSTSEKKFNIKDRIYKCRLCSKVLATLGSIRKHDVSFHNRVVNFFCSRCDKTFKRRSDRDKHLKKDHYTTPVYRYRHFCDVCGKRFYCQSYLADHIAAIHEGLGRYKCDLCGEHCRSKENLIYHLSIHQNPKKFVCDVCNYRFLKKSELRKHIKFYHVPRICDICGQDMKKQTYRYHMLKVHKKERAYSCDYCEKDFEDRANLSIHLKIVHKNEKTFPCDKCDRVFRQKTDFYFHVQNNHVKKRPFACEQCGQTFFKPNIRNRHVRTVHLKAQDFSCKTCKKTFTTKYSLQNHTNVVHKGIKPFECKFCKLRFGMKNTRNKHIVKNHASKIS